MTIPNKCMLPQPLRGLDGFSARASLQTRRKCRRYVSKGVYAFKSLSKETFRYFI